MKDLLEFYTQFSTPPLDHLRSRGHVFLEWLHHRIGKKWSQTLGGSDAMSPKEMRRYIFLELARKAYPEDKGLQEFSLSGLREGRDETRYRAMVRSYFMVGGQGKPEQTLKNLKTGKEPLLDESGSFRMDAFLSLF